MGSYPPLYDRNFEPMDWLANYVLTYVERDIRQIRGVTDLIAFQTFLGLCAGRTGQILNLSSLASDCGISQPTAKACRLVKSPKLFFYDTGLVCHLLGLRSSEQLETHPLRGALFETFVVGEIVKARMNAGIRGGLSFYRDHKGHEVDLVVESADGLRIVEIKSGATVASDWFKDLKLFSKLSPNANRDTAIEPYVIYGGKSRHSRSLATVLPWADLHREPWT